MRTWIFVASMAILVTPVVGQHWFGALELLPNAHQTALVADIDGDADPDLVRVDIPTGSMVISVNDGTGALQPGQPLALPAGGRLPITYGDIDGDGLGDLIFATNSSTGVISVAVLPGTGGGNFGTAVSTTLGGTIRGFGRADVNGDGRTDLAVANNEIGALRVRWLLGTASGALTVQPGILLPQAIGFAGLAIADVDADGIPDVALVDDASNSLQMLPTVGADTSIGPSFPIAITSATDILAGDVDGDGDDDLVVVKVAASSTPIQVVLQTGPAQWTVQTLQGAYTGDHLTGKAKLADWDGDGSQDILVRGHSVNPLTGPISLAVLGNDGSGTWTTAWTRLSPQFEAGGPFAADLDGDGNIDLIGAVELMFGDGTLDDPYGSTAPLSVAIDWDDDGDPDGLLNQTLHVNDGTGTFAPQPLVITNAPTLPNAYGFPVAHADFNGDGRIDQLVPLLAQQSFFPPTFIEMRLLITNSDGTLTDQGPPVPTGTEVAHPAVAADLDGDGDIDVANDAGAWINFDGLGNLSGPMALWPGYRPMDAGDVDQDGDTDLLAVGVSVAPTRILFNVGGNFIGADLPILGRVARWVDLEGDGDLDTIAIGVSGVFGSSLSFIEHPGTSGGAPVVQTISLSGGSPEMSVTAGDIDGDGQVDVVAALGQPLTSSFLLPEFIVTRHTGPGFSFAAPRRFLTTSVPTGLLDIDGDGDLDLTGAAALKNRRFHGPSAGVRRQYGAASPAGLPVLPVLGATGPFRPGESVTLRVRNGVSGSTGLMSIGTAESAIPNLPSPGLTVLNFPWLGFVPVALSGGGSGAGSYDFPFVVPPSFAAQAYFLQIALLDGTAPAGITYSNGLELRFGL